MMKRTVLEDTPANRELVLKLLILGRWFSTNGHPGKMADMRDMASILSDPYAYVELIMDGYPVRTMRAEVDQLLGALCDGSFEKTIQETVSSLPEQEPLTASKSQELYNDMITKVLTPHSRYAWIIDVDHLGEGQPGTNNNAVGMIGPRDASDAVSKRLATTKEGQGFRMYDDDGTLYYEGRIVGRYEGFEPLDDFGTPNAGCTSIQYQHNGQWETL